MAKRLLFLLLLFPVYVFGADCDCVPTEGLAAAKANANVIFTGRVVEAQTNWVSSGMKYTFQIEQSWLRPIEPFSTINSPAPGNCGYPFKKGKTYLVFVNKKYSLTTTICDPNLPIEDAGDFLAELGPGESPSASPGSANYQFMLLLLTVLGLIFVGFVVLFGKKFRKQKQGQ